MASLKADVGLLKSANLFLTFLLPCFSEICTLFSTLQLNVS